MRKQVVKALTVISFLIAIAIATVSSAQAQSLSYRLRVHIPFDFKVADKTYPAGEYAVSRVADYGGDNALLISSVDGHNRVMRLTSSVTSVTPKNRGTLVFHRYGDQYFLAQVWPAGTTSGRSFGKSRSERDVEKANNSAPVVMRRAPVMETVTVNSIAQ
jgi:hypothetical protein